MVAGVITGLSAALYPNRLGAAGDTGGRVDAFVARTLVDAIGAGVRLYHGVTLGAKSFRTDSTGRLEKGIERHPIVEDEVVIYANATILGRITIGRGSVIGGNVWLTRDVPPGSVISQALARSDRFGDGGGI